MAGRMERGQGERQVAERESQMAAYVVNIRSRTGQRMNQITGEPYDSFGVYSKEELDKVIRAAEKDPRDIELTYREVER
jgi:hypothetical protein